MVCFEILLNGEFLCRAGADDLKVLTNFLTWTRKPSKLTADSAETNLHLHVGGMTLENEHAHWLSEVPLSVGDELTIRIVESSTADQPTMRKSLPDEALDYVKGFVEMVKDWSPF